MCAFFNKSNKTWEDEGLEAKNKKNDSVQLIHAIEKTVIHDHLCLVYENKQEEFAAIVPFIRVGLERGEKCLYVVDENTKDEVLVALRAGGVDIDAAIEKGSFTIITKNDAYLLHGYFDPDEMIKFLYENTEKAKKEGYAALRVTGEMT